jgi:hypothetical protein
VGVLGLEGSEEFEGFEGVKLLSMCMISKVEFEIKVGEL